MYSLYLTLPMSFSAGFKPLLFVVAVSLLFTLLAAVHLADKKRVVFFGDSITQAGAKPGGYIEMLKTMVDTTQYELIGAGISGNKVTDLEARIRKDVLDKKPDVVMIYIGINDVWHFYKFEGTTGTEADRYEAGLRTLAEQIKAQGAQVVFCTPTVIGEDPDSDAEENVRLTQYADIVRRVANDTDSQLCDLRKAFSKYLKKNNKDKAYEGVLTTDGVHMNEQGNAFLAKQMKQCLP